MELAPASLETSITESNQIDNFIPGPRENPRILPENLDKNKSAIRKEIMSDHTKILAETQKGILKLIVPSLKKPVSLQDLENTASELENILPANTSTPIRPKTTTQETTPVNIRYIHCTLYVIESQNRVLHNILFVIVTLYTEFDESLPSLKLLERFACTLMWPAAFNMIF